MRFQKVDKVFWSEIVEVKFEVKDPEKIFFKYNYNENYRVAVFSAPKRQLRNKDIEMRRKAMKKYTNLLRKKLTFLNYAQRVLSITDIMLSIVHYQLMITRKMIWISLTRELMQHQNEMDDD